MVMADLSMHMRVCMGICSDCESRDGDASDYFLVAPHVCWSQQPQPVKYAPDYIEIAIRTFYKSSNHLNKCQCMSTGDSKLS